MKNSKVSVVIPIYKAEKFIEKCCRSLFEQTLDDIEYIFIDDCTPDRSIDIINQTLNNYPNRIQQVNIIKHHTNKGVAISREEGNEFANGEYIIHCDSDDWVDTHAYETMYKEAIIHNADIVICSYITVINGKYNKTKYSIKEENKENLYFGTRPFYGAVWNKLISRNLYKEHDIHIFEGINMSEDLGLTLRLRYFSKKTIIIDKPLYYHSGDNLDSIVSNFTVEKCMQIIKCAENLTYFFLQQNCSNKYSFQLLFLKFNAKRYLLFNSNIRNIGKWKTIFPETHSYIWKYTESPLNHKVIAWLIVNKMTFIAKILLFIKDNK